MVYARDQRCHGRAFGTLFLSYVKKEVMEQQLINALMKLLSKAGGGSFIKDLIQQTDQNGNPKSWTPSEIEAATQFINVQIENFGTAEAAIIIETLKKKYSLERARPGSPDTSAHEDLPEAPGVHGLR